jgi:hypothetical protein
VASASIAHEKTRNIRGFDDILNQIYDFLDYLTLCGQSSGVIESAEFEEAQRHFPDENPPGESEMTAYADKAS